MTTNEQIKWIISKHVDTNHMYDTYLPYEFHLRMVVNVFKQFKHALNPNLNENDIHLAC